MGAMRGLGMAEWPLLAACGLQLVGGHEDWAIEMLLRTWAVGLDDMRALWIKPAVGFMTSM